MNAPRSTIQPDLTDLARLVDAGDVRTLEAMFYNDRFRTLPARRGRHPATAAGSRRSYLQSLGQWAGRVEKEAMLAEARRIRFDLAPMGSNPAEALMAERASVSWLEVRLARDRPGRPAPAGESRTAASWRLPIACFPALQARLERALIGLASSAGSSSPRSTRRRSTSTIGAAGPPVRPRPTPAYSIPRRSWRCSILRRNDPSHDCLNEGLDDDHSPRSRRICHERPKPRSGRPRACSGQACGLAAIGFRGRLARIGRRRTRREGEDGGRRDLVRIDRRGSARLCELRDAPRTRPASAFPVASLMPIRRTTRGS